MEKSFCKICMKTYASRQSLWNHTKKFHTDKQNNHDIKSHNIIFINNASNKSHYKTYSNNYKCNKKSIYNYLQHTVNIFYLIDFFIMSYILKHNIS